MTSFPRLALVYVSLVVGPVEASACGGAVLADGGMAGGASQGEGVDDAGSDSKATTATARGEGRKLGCTGPSGGGSSSGGGGANGNVVGRDIDLCQGDIGCGVGLFCSRPQQCCIAGGGGVDPASCACGVAAIVVGTHCATSCPTTPQQCFQDPGGQNTDCPAGQQCLVVTSTQVRNVSVTLSTCAPAGSPGSSASSSGGQQGSGSCIDPGTTCSGSVVECSSALSCAEGQVCCETTAAACASCPASSSGSSGG